MTIDWSKAPNWATGQGKVDDDGLTVWVGEECYSYTTKPDDTFHWASSKANLAYRHRSEFRSLIERPASWTGEGPPPIGTVCEAKMPPRGVQMAIKEWTWRKVEVVRLNNGVRASEREVLVFDLENTAPAWVDELRPIRTAEQIAADEKRADIEAIVAAFRYTEGQCTHCLPYSSAERLYEIGVRLQVSQ